MKKKVEGMLTHLDSRGQAKMVDVGDKKITRREATAGGRIKMSAVAFALLKDGKAKKGDVLATARIAAICAAKKTAELIPLCHILPLDSVQVEFELGKKDVYCTSLVTATAKTGVEMEALTAVQIGLLTIYDMLKAADKSMEISEIRLLKKTGGKSDYSDSVKQKGNKQLGGKPLHPFLAAVRRNDLQEVQRMIEEGEDLYLEKRFGWQSMTGTYGNMVIGELLSLNPDELMKGDCLVVKALLVGIIKQSPEQLYTSEIAHRLGIDTNGNNGQQHMWFCLNVLKQLKKDGKVESELRSGDRRGIGTGKNRYWFIR